MIGTVIGAPAITATRKSVILSADGSDDRLTFDCTNEDAASAAASPVNAIAPAAPSPSVLKNDRRAIPAGASSSIFCTTGFISLLRDRNRERCTADRSRQGVSRRWNDFGRVSDS